MKHMVFTVEVTELASGWHVNVDAGQEGSCSVNAGSCRTALALAVPFMHGVSEPDPIGKAGTLGEMPAFLRDWPTTVDGPRDMGGADGEPLGCCVNHGNYWTDECPRCGTS